MAEIMQRFWRICVLLADLRIGWRLTWRLQRTWRIRRGDSEGWNSQSGVRTQTSVSVRLGTVWGADPEQSKGVPDMWGRGVYLRACVFVHVCSHALKMGYVFICNNATSMNSLNAITCISLCHFFSSWLKFSNIRIQIRSRTATKGNICSLYIYIQFTYILWYCDFRLTSQQWLVLQLSLKTCTISSFSWSGHVCGIAWYNFNPPGKIHSITGEINLPICSPINQPTFRAAIGPVLVHHIYRPPHTVDVWTHTGTFFEYKVGVKQPRNIVWSHPTSKA